MNLYTGFIPQNNFLYNIDIQDIYQYSSGFFYFDGSGNLENTKIIINNNAIFDENKNFIFSLDPIYKNFISGNLKNNIFDCFLSKNSDFLKKIPIFKKFLQSGAYISGVGFSGFKKDAYLNLKNQPNISFEANNEINYIITHNSDQYSNSNSNLYFTFDYKIDNIIPIQINNILINTSSLFSTYSVSGLQFPVTINPGQSLSFTGLNNFNNNFFSDSIIVNTQLETNLSNLNYNFELISENLNNSTAFVYPSLNISTNLDYGKDSNQYAFWFFNINNARAISNIYFEVTTTGGKNGTDRLYTNISSQKIFGYEPAPYTNTKLENYWNGFVNNKNITFSANETKFEEDFGNVQNLKNFAWTQPWDDSLILNDKNYIINLLQIRKTGFSINDINLYLYSKNNSSGILNWSIYKIFVTGNSDGYKNILSGLGWTTGDFTNGFPSGFPSGFPFQNSNINGFFSGFGFGKLSGYMLTGDPLHSGSLHLQREKLAPENAVYEAPIYKNKNIKINTALSIANTGFYALIFSAVPDTSVQNETGIFWPKMWPSNSLPPNQQNLVNYDSGKYFYQNGFENSGNAYSGISGVSFIANLRSNNSGLLFTGIDYNVALGINQTDDYFNKIYVNYNNSKVTNSNKNYNFVKFTITKNLSSGINFIGLDYGSGIYKISGENYLETGIIGIKRNIYRNNELFYI
jgi:hypothetical protein